MNAVELNHVGKAYRFYRRPGDRLREWLWRRPYHVSHAALSDATLALAPGETFGLVGENGAGKSTLLKLVAGTIKPSSGRVTVNGRIAALLELGAGFHPEQSGRENVYLMGALSGVGPRRMADYYAEIAAFSELPEAALERPVKTYSSGMFMRLAFATATAVDPDVLIIDEALSVGDMRFQKKSLDRIMRFRDRGKTVLFCSHNMYQIRSLCQRAAWLHDGQVRELGPTEPVITAFESHLRAKEVEQLDEQQRDFTDRQTSGDESAQASTPGGSGLAPVKLTGVTLLDADDRPSDQLQSFRRAAVAVEVDSRDDVTPYHVGIAVVRNDRENVFGGGTHFDAQRPPLRGAGSRRLTLEFPELALLSGEYRLSVYVLDDSGLQVYDMAEMINPFTVHSDRREFGMVHMPHRWRL